MNLIKISIPATQLFLFKQIVKEHPDCGYDLTQHSSKKYYEGELNFKTEIDLAKFCSAIGRNSITIDFNR